ncbi:neuronal acetylcholine receptor subunit alpha-2 [Scaptodrosophila lebanonensis]|uniref:Neuronal acetylcholine receptor subunit alpha-2 n=1 Tax=Drosophila lebanonensis TaxID=7225 RepID=A0A6J2U5D3_DROLE|nr:neuronal acetylcholine receptor subunit alpha-2 [Scaptodrosophila lebanonensis]
MQSKIKTLISGRGQQESWLCTMLLVLFMSLLISVPGASSVEAEANEEKIVNVSTTDRLYMNLFINYNKNSQPTVGGQLTNITVGLTVHYIDIDEMNGKVTLHGWIHIRWMDERLSWNLREYDNVTQLSLRPGDVWKPQITLFNAAGDEGNYLSDTQVLLVHDGSFLWVPPALYIAYCNLNMRNWPYDQQTCKLKIGSWSSNNIDAEYSKQKSALEYDELLQSTEWDISSASTKYVREETCNYIEFTFTLQRRSSMYTAVIYTPAFTIVLLALSVFWLPPQMGEKILLNGVLIVLVACFLMYFAQLLPVLAENTPLIVVFYSSCLLLLSLSTIVEVVVLYISTAKHKRRLPEFIKQLLHGKLGTVLLLSHFCYEADPKGTHGNSVSRELEEHLYDNDDECASTSPQDINPIEIPSERALQFDWVLLATAVDRLSFAGFGITFFVLSIVYGL